MGSAHPAAVGFRDLEYETIEWPKFIRQPGRDEWQVSPRFQFDTFHFFVRVDGLTIEIGPDRFAAS
jgi:hypothetical protein